LQNESKVLGGSDMLSSSLSDQFIAELGIALQAQHHMLERLDRAVEEIDSKLSDVELKLAKTDEMSAQIEELESLLKDIEDSQSWLQEEDFGDFDPNTILRLYEARQHSIFQELTRIGFKDWDSFVKQCGTYALYQGIDPLTPYEALLTPEDLQKLKDESYDAQYEWDEWDYTFVGISGVLASITDFLLVRIPQTITTGEYAGQIGSPITEWFKKYNTTSKAGQIDWFSQWARRLEKICKVPYDSQDLKGMSRKGHRIQSMGHDPVLGFVFGILDIMRGTITGFSYEKLGGVHSWVCEQTNYKPVGLIEAMLTHIGHLISDVATPMGLPAPFMTLIQGINIGSFGENNRTSGEIARWMYLQGYDFRHFLVSGITPAVIEIMLRAYILLRYYSEHGDTKVDIDSHPKYRTMLLFAHAIATAGNAGKIVLMQGNPLAINYAEWMAFCRYLVPSIKYWVFDQHRLKMEHMERINTAGWNDLLQSSDRLLETVSKLDSQVITLGNISKNY
jgi:hypothetical protein